MKTPLQILHVEDNETDCELIRATIEADGISCVVVRVETEGDFVKALESGHHDLILSDYALPSFNGVKALEIARAIRPELPFILISGTLGEEAAVESLRRGASDYLLKTGLTRLGPAIRRALQDVENRRERERSEQLQRAIYRIAETAASEQSLEEFFRSIHMSVAEIMYAENFFVALYDSDNDILSFPYFIDAFDAADKPRKAGKGLTEYVLRTGQPFLCNQKMHDEMQKRGEIELVGVPSPIWLGVPLRSGMKTFGAMVVQHYTDEQAYGEPEKKMFEFVASQVARVVERKWAEKALRESEYRVRSILENEPECVKLMTRDGRLRQINPAGMAMIEADDVNTIIGESLLPLVMPEHRKAFETLIESVFKGKTETLEFGITGLKGTRRWMDMHAVPFRDDRGTIVAVLSIARDITEKKQLEAQFLRAQRMESIGTLAGGIAHDLNNVLAPILLAVEMLRKSIPSSKEQRLLDAIEVNARRGADVVRQLLTFGRGIEGERKQLDVRPIILELEKVIRQTFSKLIEPNASVVEGLWPILGDETQVYQVLMNLCVNARDAMPDGGILSLKGENVTLDDHYVRFNVEARPGPFVVLTVSDTGHGIPPDVLDKIFDPFFTTKDIGKGTGLGLSTVRGIVKSHGGFINVYSEIGKGTRFKVYFPAFRDSSVGKDEKETMRSVPIGHGELILVVDDEEGIRDLVRNTLESFNYEVLTAANGSEALALYQANKNRIAVLLTDMMMPEMDGPTLMRAIREFDPSMKIILSSGLGSGDPTKVRGVNAVLQKPYTTEALITTLRNVLTSSP
jgi:PAS domain S-box-containing protein